MEDVDTRLQSVIHTTNIENNQNTISLKIIIRQLEGINGKIDKIDNSINKIDNKMDSLYYDNEQMRQERHDNKLVLAFPRKFHLSKRDIESNTKRVFKDLGYTKLLRYNDASVRILKKGYYAKALLTFEDSKNAFNFKMSFFERKSKYPDFYLNEFMVEPRLKRLFKIRKDLKKLNPLFDVKINKGHIYLKNVESGEKKLIRSYEDFEKILLYY